MAAEAERLLAQTDYEKMESNHLPKEFCHGNYNYHNIIFNGDKVAVINFEKAGAGLQIKDFYLLFSVFFFIQIYYNKTECTDKTEKMVMN